VFEVQGFGETRVDVVLGLVGLGVEEDAGALDLVGEALGRGWVCGLAEDASGDLLDGNF
jgi:hypothetical protein